LISFKEISDSLNESIQVRKGKQSNESLDWGHFEESNNDNKSIMSEVKEISLNDLLEDLEELM
jgi:hypothetical protein